ncbi:MAG: hypothetical protein AAGD33_23960, partial [Actinomycetota bacterium]
STTAQTYPVHCTLTGFFRREGDRADAVLARLSAVVDSFGPAPRGAVRVDRLGVHDEWVGLELTSSWLLDVIAAVVAADDPGTDEDALRPKDWLHVSLAYGVDDLAPYASFARQTVDASLDASWRVGFWERHPDGRWTET